MLTSGGQAARGGGAEQEGQEQAAHCGRGWLEGEGGVERCAGKAQDGHKVETIGFAQRLPAPAMASITRSKPKFWQM